MDFDNGLHSFSFFSPKSLNFRFFPSQEWNKVSLGLACENRNFVLPVKEKKV
jgi:hypothetical protein